MSNLILKICPTEKTMESLPWDVLTGVYNRAFFLTRLQYALERTKQLHQNKFAVLHVDLGQSNKIDYLFGNEIPKHNGCCNPKDAYRQFLIREKDCGRREQHSCECQGKDPIRLYDPGSAKSSAHQLQLFLAEPASPQNGSISGSQQPIPEVSAPRRYRAVAA